MKKYVILPASGDINRGDQALTWETMKVAKDSGHKGQFYILSEKVKTLSQSREEGLKVLTPILKHPSRKFEDKDNTEYDVKIKLKWGFVAIFDLLKSLLILNKYTRKIMLFFLSEDDIKTFNILQESEACFVKGGGFIHTSGKITDSYTVYYQLYHIMLAQSLGKPVYIMPNSFGPFYGFGVKRMVKNTLRGSKLVTVRESISKDMLDEINVESKLFPDLGFNLTKQVTNNNIVKNLIGENKNRKLIGITVRPYRFPNSEQPKKSYEEYINSIIKFTKWLYDNNYMPVFIEQVLSETTHESDMTAIKQVYSDLNEFEYKVISDVDYDCRDLKFIYSQMEYTIGTRFHSVIFSFSENVPSIAIEYGGNKGAGILKDMNLSRYGIPIEEITFERLRDQFNELVNNNELIRVKINNYMNHVNLKRAELIDLIRNTEVMGKK